MHVLIGKALLALEDSKNADIIEKSKLDLGTLALGPLPLLADRAHLRTRRIGLDAFH
jgi:hypothetical protein